MTKVLPSLFGRFTAILRDHDDLGQSQRQLRAMCRALQAAAETIPIELDPPTLLGALRARLAEHFEAEESERYFGVVVEERPSSRSQIARLKWEHFAMLRASEKLCELALDPERWRELPGPTDALLADLQAHERQESALLQSLFLGSGDQ